MTVLEQISAMGLQSEKVFYYFTELAKIPHGSRNTKQISDYLVDFAKNHNLEYYQVKSNNLVMIQEASAGYEAYSPVIIQGHMDMVCEKESDCWIDFATDGLELYIDGDFLRAKGTTLGGDDGIAVAYALALLDSPNIVHPRLEIVLTVDEEIGMLGAMDIDLSMLKGHRMLNIDSDLEGHFLTSCAGGMTTVAAIPVTRQSQTGRGVKLCLTGLLGGHSGSEIDKEHGNALVLMGRVLKDLTDRMTVGIVSIEGGLKDNAIPRECTAQLLLPKDRESSELASALQVIAEIESVLQKEYAVSDAGVCIKAEDMGDTSAEILSYVSQTKVLFYLNHVPNGVQHMSSQIPGLVETSCNVGILKLEGDVCSVVTSLRSSVTSRKLALADKLQFLAEFLGGDMERRGDYPAWEYVADSALRDSISAVYTELFKEAPVFEAIHAGLECGILSGKIKDLDCVSFGPNNYDIHTPKERLSIASADKIWRLLVEFLKRG